MSDVGERKTGRDLRRLLPTNAALPVHVSSHEGGSFGSQHSSLRWCEGVVSGTGTEPVRGRYRKEKGVLPELAIVSV